MMIDPPKVNATALRGWDNSALRARLGGVVIEARSIEAELRSAAEERARLGARGSDGRRTR